MFVQLKEQLPLATFNASTIIQDLSFSQRAESARADTGRRCPKSGMEDFLVRRPVFYGFWLRKRKVQKSIRRCQINRLPWGYKEAIDKFPGPLVKTDFRAEIQIFGPPKKSAFRFKPTGQSCANKKVPFSQIDIILLANFRCFFLKKKRIFCPFSAFL